MTPVCFKFTYTIPTFLLRSSNTISVQLPNASRCLEKFQRLEDLRKELDALRDKRQTKEISWVLRFFYRIHEHLLQFRVHSWEKTYLSAITEAMQKARKEGKIKKWSTRENCAGEYLPVSSEKGWDIYRCFLRRNPKRDWVYPFLPDIPASA